MEDGAVQGSGPLHLGLENAAPPIAFKPWGWILQPVVLKSSPGAGNWQMQPFQLFSSPGVGKCNPSVCFQGLGLESATPPAVFKPWG